MTVKELISKLSKYPQDAIVEVPDWYSNETTEADNVGLVDDGIGKTVRILP